MKSRMVQGEFLSLSGEKAPPPAPKKIDEPHVYQVSELTREIRNLLEGRFPLIHLEGEIGNYRLQSSGHHYFSLRDKDSQISCVLFRGNAVLLQDWKPAEGEQVRVKAELSVYAARGQYQLIIREMAPCGAGALQARFEALKQKLRAEGLFDDSRKRPLPRFAQHIGIITSPTAAAFQDFLKVLKSRLPTSLYLKPVRVQGAGASREIAEAIRFFAQSHPGLPRMDLLVVMRGGGSTEDLWEFNEEVVARAIAESPIPVLTGIGHETDFTIADFVADFRAPTPSAAAAAALPDRAELQRHIQNAMRHLYTRVEFFLDRFRAEIDSLLRVGVFREPLRVIGEHRQHIDMQYEALQERMSRRQENAQSHLQRMHALLRAHAPVQRLTHLREHLQSLLSRMPSLPQRALNEKKELLYRHIRTLEVLNPQAVLSRGFTMTTTSDGKILTQAVEALREKEILTLFSDGRIATTNPKEILS